ncbi:MAG TPA: hypothetical protein VKT27_05485 [Candidatus Binataceae bacterium]|nr:hypothetical protein [Candidatus Binataceae bacterium]
MRLRLTGRLLLTAAIAAIALDGCAYGLVSGRQVDLQRAGRINSDVQELREHYFKTEVPIVVMDRAQAQLAMTRVVTGRRDSLAFKRAETVGVLTGLYPPGTDLQSQTIETLSGQALGFYDPENRRLVLLGPQPRPSLWSRIKAFFGGHDTRQEAVVARELTHALQDQYFDYSNALNRISDNEDRLLAFRAVVEGDAMLVAYGYTAGIIDGETVRELLANVDALKPFAFEAAAAPEALRDSLAFEYREGTRFVCETYLRGGWSAVNMLYRNPPRSTREVLEPALYFSHAAPPVTIVPAGWQQVLAGWREVGEDTYGELLLRAILARNGSAQAAELARAWRGDRIAALQGAGQTTVVWIVVTSDAASATALAGAYEPILARNAPAPHHVEHRGAAVLALIGPGALEWRALAPSIWRASAIGAGPYPSAG